MSRMAFVNKRIGAFHLVVDAARAPELFAAHLIRTRTVVGDYEVFSSCPAGRIRSRAEAFLKEYKEASLFDSKLSGNLSQQQSEILELIGRGLRNKEIAERVNIGVRTVKYHTREIFKKLGMDSRMQLIAFVNKK